MCRSKLQAQLTLTIIEQRSCYLKTMNTKDDIKIPTARHSVPFRSAGQRASTLPSDAADAPDSERQRPETPFQDSPEMVESLLPTPPSTHFLKDSTT
jgi:hypothetical protein